MTKETIYLDGKFCMFIEKEYSKSWKKIREQISKDSKIETGYPNNSALICPICNKELEVLKPGDKIMIDTKISDAEFVYLARIDAEIKETLDKFLSSKYVDEEQFPEFGGRPYFLIEKKNLFCYSISIRFVNVSDFKAADRIYEELNKINGINYIYMTKDNGVLYIKISIKRG